MIKRRCLCCKELFIPRRNVADQKYCGKDQCRQFRRADWQRKKLKSDPDYAEYQAKAQKKWRKSHPAYMRRYRKTHPQYREKEKKRRANNRLFKNASRATREKFDATILSLERVVKMDSSAAQQPEKSKYYRMSPLFPDSAVKMDSYIVQLIVIEQDAAIEATS